MRNLHPFYRRCRSRRRGAALMMILVMTAIAVVILTGAAGWAILTVRVTKQTQRAEQAFLMAEAGIEYYRWHLAHNPTDYQDGTGHAGPYIHNYYDKYGNLLGTYTLTITPPIVGSTIVTVKSVGKPAPTPLTRRAVEVQLGKPSWAKYAVVANDVMRFGEGTETFGPIHSNDGIRFDGLAHNLVTSAVASYNDPDHSGGSEFGVHTHIAPVDPLPPATVPARTDVFQAGRLFPVPSVDFDGISADLATMKTDAQANGRYFAPSAAYGYNIVLKTNGTFDLYKVTSTAAPPGSCYNSNGDSDWGTWSVGTQALVANYTNPPNGIIFVEDHVWISGQINHARITIAAAKFPESASTYRNITVNDNLTYSNYDGSDSLAFIAQGDFNVGLYSANVLRIDGAILAENGRAGRHYYSSDCGSNYIRSSLTSYGMVGSNQRYGFAFTNGTGYDTRDLIYDGHFLFSPPPAFPPTSDQYTIVSWKEVKP